MKLILKTLITGAIGLPTVMWHGMGDHAESNAMHHIKKMILGKFLESLKILHSPDTGMSHIINMPIKFCLTI